MVGAWVPWPVECYSSPGLLPELNMKEILFNFIFCHLQLSLILMVEPSNICLLGFIDYSLCQILNIDEMALPWK